MFISFTSFGQDEGFSSQPQKRGEYGWVLYVSGGAGYYLSNRGAPDYLERKISNLSHVSNIRIMWHPDHLLKVGLETGHMTFYSYRFKDSTGLSGKAKLYAIPVLIEWTMAVTKRLNLFAGSGVYFLRTTLDYQGRTVSPKLSIGWMAAGSYIHPLSENVGLGTEVKWMEAAETNNGIVSLQLQLVWKFLKW
ncbi:MAG: hypothetical protein EON98_10360 [Chitinophagaceae bacterium]|nr:MAG: hypothetical protein EON98_10360 [Chitinophagaceae bacterium]